MRTAQKRKGTEEQQEREVLVVRVWQFYCDSFTETGCRENKLDTGEDRMSQRMRRSQKIRTDCQS